MPKKPTRCLACYIPYPVRPATHLQNLASCCACYIPYPAGLATNLKLPATLLNPASCWACYIQYPAGFVTSLKLPAVPAKPRKLLGLLHAIPCLVLSRLLRLQNLKSCWARYIPYPAGLVTSFKLPAAPAKPLKLLGLLHPYPARFVASLKLPAMPAKPR